jgi:hypothetical protein
MSKGAPDAPDPVKVSAEQTKSNIATGRENARLNAYNLFSPFGSSTFLFDPTDPRNVGKTDLVPTGQTLTFSPEVQDFITRQLAVSNGMANHQLDQLAKFPTESFSLDEIPDTSAISKTMFDRQMGLRQSEFDDAQKKLQATLSERGIPIGSEIYNNEMNRFERAKNETVTGMAQDADLAAGNEFQRLLANKLQERRLPFDEMNLFQGATPGVQQPGFANQIPSAIANTDVSGNYWNSYNAQVNAYNAQNQGMAGILGAGATLAAKSSKKYKEDFHPVEGESVLKRMEKLPISDYKYKSLAQALFNVPQERTGPMAEDWAKQFGGDGETIDVVSMLGNTMAAVKALDKRTENLKPKSEKK